MRSFHIFVAAASLSACANVSPVMETGNNSYMVSVVSHSQFNEALIKANQEAAQYCAKQGKKIVVHQLDMKGTEFMSSSSARVQFSCYAENDPEYQQSILRPVSR
jgi:hypothetical protein